MHAGKFVVRNDHWTGQADIGADFGAKPEPVDNLVDPRCCSAAGLQGIVIQHRPDLNVAVQVQWPRIAL